jgi:hypothetical protein
VSELTVQVHSRSARIATFPAPPIDGKELGEPVAVTGHFVAVGPVVTEADEPQPFTNDVHSTTIAPRSANVRVDRARRTRKEKSTAEAPPVNQTPAPVHAFARWCATLVPLDLRAKRCCRFDGG